MFKALWDTNATLTLKINKVGAHCPDCKEKVITENPTESTRRDINSNVFQFKQIISF